MLEQEERGVSIKCVHLYIYIYMIHDYLHAWQDGTESFKSEASFFAASCIKMANDIYMHHVQLRPGRGYLALGGGRAQVEEDEEGHV